MQEIERDIDEAVHVLLMTLRIVENDYKSSAHLARRLRTLSLRITRRTQSALYPSMLKIRNQMQEIPYHKHSAR